MQCLSCPRSGYATRKPVRLYIARDRVLQGLRAKSTHLEQTYGTSYSTRTMHSPLNTASSFWIYHADRKRDCRLSKAGPGRGREAPFRQFSEELTSYMRAIAPVLNWTVSERHARASSFVQNELLPLRMSAFGISCRNCLNRGKHISLGRGFSRYARAPALKALRTYASSECMLTNFTMRAGAPFRITERSQRLGIATGYRAGWSRAFWRAATSSLVRRAS